MNPQTLEEPTISTNEDLEIDEDLEDDPNEPEVIWNMETFARATADRKAGRLETVSLEDFMPELHVED